MAVAADAQPTDKPAVAPASRLPRLLQRGGAAAGLNCTVLGDMQGTASAIMDRHNHIKAAAITPRHTSGRPSGRRHRPSSSLLSLFLLPPLADPASRRRGRLLGRL